MLKTTIGVVCTLQEDQMPITRPVHRCESHHVIDIRPALPTCAKYHIRSSWGIRGRRVQLAVYCTVTGFGCDANVNLEYSPTWYSINTCRTHEWSGTDGQPPKIGKQPNQWWSAFGVGFCKLFAACKKRRLVITPANAFSGFSKTAEH